jgi:two-component system chemotaxis response regulator CheB
MGTSGTNIRVIVADDSSFMRLLISDILNSSDKGIEVIDTARDGKEAFEKSIASDPDVLILDMIMGEHDGLYAVENLMRSKPLPILILSSLGNRDIRPIIQALEAGAFDHLNKPHKGEGKLREIDRELIQKVEAAAKIDRSKLKLGTIRVDPRPKTFKEDCDFDVIAIGASTGGPATLERILLKFPPNLVVPVLIVQHMPDRFLRDFTVRLDEMTPIEVKYGEEGTLIEAGKVYVMPGDINPIVESYGNGKKRVASTSHSFPAYDNPSIDGLLESVAHEYTSRSIGVLCTGMGKDGASGLKAIRDQGGWTLAQDEATSVVHGMPGEAIAIDAVDQVLPSTAIGDRLISCLS